VVAKVYARANACACEPVGLKFILLLPLLLLRITLLGITRPLLILALRQPAVNAQQEKTANYHGRQAANNAASLYSFFHFFNHCCFVV
jgi:hypothetical protein